MGCALKELPGGPPGAAAGANVTSSTTGFVPVAAEGLVFPGVVADAAAAEVGVSVGGVAVPWVASWWLAGHEGLMCRGVSDAMSHRGGMTG